MHVCHSLRPLDPFLPSGGEGRREGERGEEESLASIYIYSCIHIGIWKETIIA